MLWPAVAARTPHLRSHTMFSISRSTPGISLTFTFCRSTEQLATQWCSAQPARTSGQHQGRGTARELCHAVSMGQAEKSFDEWVPSYRADIRAGPLYDTGNPGQLLSKCLQNVCSCKAYFPVACPPQMCNWCVSCWQNQPTLQPLYVHNKSAA